MHITYDYNPFFGGGQGIHNASRVQSSGATWWPCVNWSPWAHLNTPHPTLNTPLPSHTQEKLHVTPHTALVNLTYLPPKNRYFIYQLEGRPGQCHLPSTSPIVLGKSPILLNSSVPAMSHLTKLNLKQTELRFKSLYRDKEAGAQPGNTPSKALGT